MAEQTPFYMDINNVYSGDELGLPYRDIMGEGVVAAGDLAVTAHAAANSIDVAAGSGWVTGDTDVNRQPTYRIYNDAVVNKGITPDPTNPRYVRVFAQITDATFSGASRNWVITTLHGTPAGSPAVPALPASALDLATILVPAAAASSAAYTITDTRVRAKVGAGAAQINASGAAMSTIFDVVVGRGQAGDPASPAATIDSNTILGGNIPQTYKHLRLHIQAISNGAQDNGVLTFNNDTTNGNYTRQFLQGTGAGVAASTAADRLAFSLAASTVPGRGTTTIDIHDYANASIAKSALSFGYIGTSLQMFGLQWQTAAAITRLALTPNSVSWLAPSRVTLYGLS